MADIDQGELAGVVADVLAGIVTEHLDKVRHSVQCIGADAAAGSISASRSELANAKLKGADKPTFERIARDLRGRPAATEQLRANGAIELDLRRLPPHERPPSARYLFVHEAHVTWPESVELPPVRLHAWVFTSQRPSTPFTPLILRAAGDRLVGAIRAKYSPPSREAFAAAIRSGALPDALATLARLHDLDGVALWHYDETRRRFRPLATFGISDTPLSVPTARAPGTDRKGVVSQVMPDRRPVVYDVEDASLWQPRSRGRWEPFDRELFTARAWRSCVALPIVCAGRLVGALSAYSPKSAASFAEMMPSLTEEAALCGDAILIQRERAIINALTARYDEEIVTANVSLAALSLSHDVMHYYRSVVDRLEQTKGYLDTRQIPEARAALTQAQETMTRTEPAISAMRKLATEARNSGSERRPKVTPDVGTVLSELEPLLRSILPLYSRTRRLKAENVEVTVRGTPAPVSIPPAALERIVVNLCVNSAQWSASRVWVAAHFGRSDDELQLVVRDDGRGIPAADRESVFDRFFSGRGGSGLGLYVVQTLASRAGGEVYLQSYDRSDGADQRGTIMTVVLPTIAARQRS